jgi:oxaloacetate decarboxylase gamma subunit
VSDLLLEGLNLAMYGMGTVFVFLTLLVGATTLMSRLLREAPTVVSSVAPSAQSDPRLLAAITAAVHQYRNRQE